MKDLEFGAVKIHLRVNEKAKYFYQQTIFSG